MKCTTCGTMTFLLRTSEEGDYCVKRTYRCPKKHEHYTLEVLPSGISKRDLASAERGAAHKAATYARNQEILRDLSSMPAETLGKKWNLTGARIRQLRDTVPVEQPKEQSDETASTRIHRLS